jgi:phenylpropionate dioxygenase-like ring-hydroxylating dioxygenase large terminal subunit
MLVYNAWYIGAWADELKPQGVLGRTLLELPVVFYRGEDGRAYALEDRCCHRALPLSHGCVIGDQLQCGYHGLVYDHNGICVKVPGQERVPAQAKVRSYPVVEQDQMLWIWMGEPALADASIILHRRYATGAFGGRNHHHALGERGEGHTLDAELRAAASLCRRFQIQHADGRPLDGN